MRLVIVGASGVIGFTLYNSAKVLGYNVIGTYNNKVREGLIKYDIRFDSLRAIVPDLGSNDIVYFLSAYTNPSWIYDNQAAAYSLNLDATKRSINEILETKARLVFMSSVEIFDGNQGNYNEQSTPNPLNLYGRMKYEIEKYLTQKKSISCIVRTGWNIGWGIEGRCVIKLTYKTLLRHGAKMAKDNIFSIIDVRDTARGLLKLGKKPSLKICHFASTQPVVRTELAELIMKFSKYKDLMAYQVGSFSDMPYSEPRGRRNHLDNSFAKSALKMNFNPVKEIVKQKVELLDNKIEFLK